MFIYYFFQANHFRDDSLRVNGLICGQTSVELKRARSLVRVQEIQATLHEQRWVALALLVPMEFPIKFDTVKSLKMVHCIY